MELWYGWRARVTGYRTGIISSEFARRYIHNRMLTKTGFSEGYVLKAVRDKESVSIYMGPVSRLYTVSHSTKLGKHWHDELIEYADIRSAREAFLSIVMRDEHEPGTQKNPIMQWSDALRARILRVEHTQAQHEIVWVLGKPYVLKDSVLEPDISQLD